MSDDKGPSKSGRFPFSPIVSPKQSESSDGVLEKTGGTAPGGAAKPK
jgi:hypothetical protein